MDIREYKTLNLYSNEKELCDTLELIGDNIYFRGYSEDEVTTLVKLIINIDIMSLNYTARELILSVLCDAVSYYDILNKINWVKIITIKDNVEDDLKEYINDFFIGWSNL